MTYTAHPSNPFTYRLRSVEFGDYITAVVTSDWNETSDYIEVATTDNRKPSHLATTINYYKRDHFLTAFVMDSVHI